MRDWLSLLGYRRCRHWSTNRLCSHSTHRLCLGHLRLVWQRLCDRLGISVIVVGLLKLRMLLMKLWMKLMLLMLMLSMLLMHLLMHRLGIVESHWHGRTLLLRHLSRERVRIYMFEAYRAHNRHTRVFHQRPGRLCVCANCVSTLAGLEL